MREKTIGNMERAKKSLFRNSIYNVLYKGLNVLFPLITTMYVSRVLLADGIGRVSSAKNLAAYFVLVAALGMPTYATKRIAECRKGEKKLNQLFSELFFINASSSLICTLLYVGTIFKLPQCKTELPLYLIVGLQIFLNTFNIDWFYQGIEEFGYILKRSTIIKVVCLGFILLFVKTQEDYLWYALASVLGCAFNYIFNVIHLHGMITPQLKNLQIKKHLSSLFILLGSTIAIEIYTLSDVTMLTFMTNPTHVGYYTNSMNGVKTIKELIVAICMVMLPRLSYVYANGELETFCTLVRNGMKVLLFFCLPAFIGCVILADLIIKVLFGEAFMPAMITIRILAVSIITISISNFLGHNTMIVVGKEKIVLVVSIISALINIVLNSFLIPIINENGAAIASVICELIVCTLYLSYINAKVCALHWDRDVASIIASSLIMGLIIWLVHSINIGVIPSFIMSFTIGILVYASATIFLKNSVAILLRDKLYSLLKIKRGVV